MDFCDKKSEDIINKFVEKLNNGVPDSLAVLLKEKDVLKLEQKIIKRIKKTIITGVGRSSIEFLNLNVKKQYHKQPIEIILHKNYMMKEYHCVNNNIFSNVFEYLKQNSSEFNINHHYNDSFDIIIEYLESMDNIQNEIYEILNKDKNYYMWYIPKDITNIIKSYIFEPLKPTIIYRGGFYDNHYDSWILDDLN